MRRCKVCKIKKEHIFFDLDPQSRRVYKDVGGSAWHGKVCGQCHTLTVQVKACKEPLLPGNCIVCGVLFNRKVINKIVCGEQCYKTLRKRREPGDGR